MLVRHVRVPRHFINPDNFTFRTEWHPIATIVALDENKIGLAVCGKKDSFAKKRGIHIAVSRAEKEASPKDYDDDRRKFKFIDKNGTVSERSLSEIIDDELDEMEERASRYFNNNVDDTPTPKKKGFIRRLFSRS